MVSLVSRFNTEVKACRFLVGQITDCYQKVQQEFFPAWDAVTCNCRNLHLPFPYQAGQWKLQLGSAKSILPLLSRLKSVVDRLYIRCNTCHRALSNLPASGPAEIYILRIGGNIGAVIIEIGQPQMKLHLLVWSHIFGY